MSIYSHSNLNNFPVYLEELCINYNYNNIFNKEIKNTVLPESVKKITIYSHCKLINNLPLYIEEVYIKFHYDDKINEEIEINNLPILLQKIIIDDKKYLKYITKIPFNCVLEIRQK
jgi:hypothetical protein